MLNWKRFVDQLEAFKRSPMLPVDGQKAVQGIIDAAGTPNYELRLEGVVARYLDAVFVIAGRESALIAEEGRIVRQIDSDILRTTPLAEYVHAPDLVRRRARGEHARKQAERAIEQFPSRLELVLRDFAALATGKVPDFPGALYDFVREIEQYRIEAVKPGSKVKPPEVPPEVASIAHRIRRGDFSMTMVPMPPAISMHWSMDSTDFPERLNEPEAVRYLEVCHGVRIGGTALGERAAKNEALKSGKFYLRDALRDAALAGKFEHGNKGRTIRS
jgi:hypothetical protein